MGKKLSKSALILMALVLLSIIGLTGCGGQVVATVNDKPITQEDLDLAMEPYVAYMTGMDGTLEEYMDLCSNLCEEYPEEMTALFSQRYELQLGIADLPLVKEYYFESLYQQYNYFLGKCLNDLIEQDLILQDAQEQGLELNETRLQREWTIVQRQNSDPAQFAEWMVVNGCYNQTMFDKMRQIDYQSEQIWSQHEKNYAGYLNNLYKQAEVYITPKYQQLAESSRSLMDNQEETPEADPSLEENQANTETETEELDQEMDEVEIVPEDTGATPEEGMIIPPAGE